MTNEQAKQEAIKFILKLGYEIFEDNHFVKNSKSINIEEKSIANEKGEQIFFKSFIELFSILKGDNNGWVRIEPNASNLPEKGEYRWLFESGVMSNFYYDPGDVMSVKLTHYKPITPELKPIY